MALADLWQHSPELIIGKHIQQIIAFAGSGKLREANDASVEFRHFLTLIPSQLLEVYGLNCLADKFDDSGLALQDIVNEAGRRVGFGVTNGRYRGVAGEAIGFDGLWQTHAGHAIVVEVKTTDAYRINLETIAGYRRALAKRGDIVEDQSSILIVVGREDTGGLEAQVRGSRHAWDIRLISVDALFKLVHLRESLDQPHIFQQICDLLIPREFTKVDSIIDITFYAAEEVKSDIPPEDITIDVHHTTPNILNDSRYITTLQLKLNTTLIKRTRTFYATPDNTVGVICASSKVYERNGRIAYWFAFHPHQQDNLQSVVHSYIAYVCGNEETILLIPYTTLSLWLDGLWTTERNGKVYWHFRIQHIDGRLLLDRRKGFDRLDVTQYLLAKQITAVTR